LKYLPLKLGLGPSAVQPPVSMQRRVRQEANSLAEADSVAPNVDEMEKLPSRASKREWRKCIFWASNWGGRSKEGECPPPLSWGWGWLGESFGMAADASADADVG
jgi:hypothetical protein